MSRWYRAYEGTVTDAKLAEVALVAGCSRSVVIATWHAMLENAACVNDGGRIDIPSRRIAAVLCEPFDTIETVMLGFETVGLLLDSQITSWKKRQYESDSSTERSRKHRQSKRNDRATLQQRDATPPETENRDIDSSEPKGSSPRPFACPVGVDPQVWKDLLGNRKRKRLGTSETAWRKFQGDLAKVSAQTGIPPPQLIEMCTAKGWGAIYDPRDNRDERPDSNPTATALSRVIGAIEDRH